MFGEWLDGWCKKLFLVRLLSIYGADADAEMTAICGMSFLFLWVLTTEPTSYYQSVATVVFGMVIGGMVLLEFTFLIFIV